MLQFSLKYRNASLKILSAVDSMIDTELEKTLALESSSPATMSSSFTV